MAPKAIVFSDFDGTITQKDSNDYLTDNYGFGYDRRSELNSNVLKGRMSFRDSFKLMLDSVAANKPFEECKHPGGEHLAGPQFQDVLRMVSPERYSHHCPLLWDGPHHPCAAEGACRSLGGQH